jgi:hypothetical protein
LLWGEEKKENFSVANNTANYTQSYRQTLAAYRAPQSAGIFDYKNLTPVGQQMPKTFLVYSLKKS